MMLVLDGQLREFMPIQAFRTLVGLPSEFGIRLLNTRDYAASGSSEHTSPELQAVRKAVLAVVPRLPPSEDWLTSILALQRVFQQSLGSVKDKIGINSSEVDIAAMSFGDVCRAFVFTLLQARK